MAEEDFGFQPATAVADTGGQDFGFTPEPSRDHRDLVTQSLLDHGASPVAAAAILGDIQQESAFNPRGVGDRGSSFGLLQVGGPMFRQFENDQAAQGIRPGDPAYTYNQAPYVMDKFKEQHPDRWEAMQNAPDAPTALQIFRGTKDWGYGIAGKRYQYAQNYEQALKGVPVQQVDQEVRVEKAIPIQVVEHQVSRAQPVQDGEQHPSYLEGLTPSFKDKVQRWSDYVYNQTGYLPKIISGHRSIEEQSKLYERHKRGGPLAAPPGKSYHNFGSAVDISFIDPNGKTITDEDNPELFRAMHKSAEAFGIKGIGESDPPHFQDADYAKVSDIPKGVRQAPQGEDFGFVPETTAQQPGEFGFVPETAAAGGEARVNQIASDLLQGPDQMAAQIAPTPTGELPPQPVQPEWTTGVGHVGGPMELPEPPVSPEQFQGPFTSRAVQTVAGEAAKAAALVNPATAIPIAIGRQFEQTRPLSEGIVKGVGKLGEGLAEPENLAIIAATEGLGLPAVAGRAVSGYFAAQMASQLPDVWQAFKDAPDFESQVAVATQGIGQLLIAVAAGKHAVVEPRIPGVIYPKRGGAVETVAETGGAVAPKDFSEITVPGAEAAPAATIPSETARVAPPPVEAAMPAVEPPPAEAPVPVTPPAIAAGVDVADLDPETKLPYLLPSEIREQFTPSETTAPEVEQVSNYYGGRFGRPVEQVTPPPVSAPARRGLFAGRGDPVAEAETLANVYGATPLWIRGIYGRAPTGGVSIGDKILLNVEGLRGQRFKAVHQVAGHELQHFLEFKMPDLAAELRAATGVLRPEDLPQGPYRSMLEQLNYGEHQYVSEFTGDFLAETLANPIMLDHALGRNPGLMRRVGYAIKEFIGRTITKIRGRSDLDPASASAIVKDLNAARKGVMDVLSRARERAGKEKELQDYVKKINEARDVRPPEEERRRQFYSPSTADMTFEQAHQAMSGPTQTHAINVSRVIDESLGHPAQYRNGIGDWSDGAENSVMAQLGNVRDFDELRYNAALKGKALQQKSVLAFEDDHVNGQHSLYTFAVPTTDLARIRDVMDQHDVKFRTLLPEQGRTPIVVFDDAPRTSGIIDKLDKAVGKLSDEPVTILETPGRGEFVGDSPTREQSAINYDRIAEKYVSQYPNRQSFTGRLPAPPGDYGGPIAGAAREGQVARPIAEGRDVRPPEERARETLARATGEHGDIAKTNVQRVIDHPVSSYKQASNLRRVLPRELRNLSRSKMLGNGIEFFKRNLVNAARAALKEPWAPFARKQYQGYNRLGHRMADEFGNTPERVMGGESALSPNTSPEQSHEAARRLMKIMRDNAGDRFDEKMMDWARNATTKNEKGVVSKLYLPAALRYLKGKSFSELPKNSSETPSTMQAKWARAFDEVYHPDRTIRHIRPDGTLGDTVKTVTGKEQPFAWTTFNHMQNGIDALTGARPIDEILKTPKVANYYMSKLLAFEPSNHVVVDTHHTSLAYGNSLPASHDLIKKAFQAERAGPNQEFAGMYSIIHEATLRAAREVGMDPKELQALVWSYQRGYKSPDAFGKSALGKAQVQAIQNLWKDAASGKLTERQARETTEQIASKYHGGKIPAPGYFTGPGDRGVTAVGDAGKPAELPQGGRYVGAAERGGRGYAAPGIAEEPPGLAEARDIPPPTQEELEAAAGDREKMRGHVATVQRMTEVSPDVKARVESYYTPTTLDAVNRAATETINTLGLDRANDRFMRSRTNDVDTMALGHNVALRYDQLNRYDEAAAVREEMANRLTNPAQTLWYISTIGKTSPEGLIDTAQKLVAGMVRPETQPLLDQINRLRAQISALKDQKAKDAAIQIAVRQMGRVQNRAQRVGPKQLEDLLTRHAQGDLDENQLANTLAKYFKIPRLTPENINKIKAAQKAWADVPDDQPLLKQIRAADMMDSVYGLVPHTFWEKVRAASVISMILHGKLPLRIGASSAVRLAGNTVVDGIMNFVPDVANIFSGRRTMTGGQVRGIIEGLYDPVRAYLAGYTDARIRGLAMTPSFREGMHALITRSSLVNRGMLEVQSMRKGTHTFSSRFGRLAENTVNILHNVVPLAFYDAAYRSSLYRQMRAARVATPTADMVFDAHVDANKVISNNPTVAYEMARGIRKILDMPTAPITKGRYGLGTALLPFALKPASLLTEGATWTPLGLGKAAYEVLSPLLRGEPIRPREVGGALIKAALGTGLAVGAGYQLGKLGILTGAPDQNKDLDAMRRASGMGAYKINVSELKRRVMSGNWWSVIPFTNTEGQRSHAMDGDYIINYNWLEPVAFPVAAGADLAQSEKDRVISLKKGRITPSAVASAGGAAVQSLTDAPMLQGVQQFAQAIGEKDYMRAFVGLFANIPGNFVPALVRQTAQYMDNTVRETRGTFTGPITAGRVIDREASSILSQIPGLEQRYPAKYDVFGEAVQRYNYGNNSLLNVFFNPAMVSRFKENPQLAEMERLYQATGAQKGEPRVVPATLFINGKQVELTNEQIAAYQHYVGKESSAVITRLLASPKFASEPMQTKQAVMSQVLSAVNTAAKIDLFGDSPVKVGMGATGPTLSQPSPMDIAALIQARRSGLNRPGFVQPQPADPRAPLWRLAPPPPLPSLAP
jgi:hypothetical protein